MGMMRKWRTGRSGYDEEMEEREKWDETEK